MGKTWEEWLAEETPREKELREQYAVPNFYGPAVTMHDGKVFFSFCDSDITINPDGTATESWMGLNYDCTSHEFKTIPWTKRGTK